MGGEYVDEQHFVLITEVSKIQFYVVNLCASKCNEHVSLACALCFSNVGVAMIVIAKLHCVANL